MATKDLYSNVAVVNLMDPQDTNDNDDQKSNILDTNGFESASVIVHVGTITGVAADAYLTPVLQESDTTAESGFADVAAADIVGGFTKIDAATEDSVAQVAGYIGSKRYVRVNLDYTGTGITASLVGVIGLLGNAHVSPVTAPAAVSAT